MYASITPSKVKKPRYFSEVSPAFKNPKIVRDEFHPWTTNGQKSLKEPYVKGEPILRDPRPSYILRVGESYRQDGKVKSRQKHIYTFNEWQIIDGFLDSQEYKWEYSPGACIDYDWYEKQFLKTFPDADPLGFWPVIQAKLKPLEDPILAAFKETEEFDWWIETLVLKTQLKQEQAQERAKNRQYKEQSRQYQYSNYQEAFTGNTQSPGNISLSKDEARIIDDCYKIMATQLHPDKGGDPEDMKILNRLKDKIRKGV